MQYFYSQNANNPGTVAIPVLKCQYCGQPEHGSVACNIKEETITLPRNPNYCLHEF